MTKTRDDKGKSDRRVGGDPGKMNGTESVKGEKATEEKVKTEVSQDEDAIVQRG